MSNKKTNNAVPELDGIDISSAIPSKATKIRRFLAFTSGLAFLLIFQISEQIHSMLFSFLKTQEISAYTPISLKTGTLLFYIFFSILLYCIILVILRYLRHDSIKKGIKSASYAFGHILVCFPVGLLALRGINTVITFIFNIMPFEVWHIAWLIVDLSLYTFIYGPITLSMESMADTYLKIERKNHSLGIYKACGSSYEKVSTLVPNGTFSICYKALKMNINELRDGNIFIITEYGALKKERHHWHYNYKGELLFRD